MAIFICNKPGRLGNRLILYSNLLCFGKEFGVKIFNPSFDEYGKFFQGTSGSCKFLEKFYYNLFNIISRIANRLRIKNKFIYSLHIEWHEFFHLNNDQLSEPLFSKICLLSGWRFRSGKLVQKHKPFLIDRFRPKKEFQTQIDNFKKKYFNGNNIIVGVHIRREDYKTFEGGKYYYSLENYFEIIRNLNAEFKFNVKFMITSNDNEALTYFKKINLPLFFAPNHELLDMYCLSNCDYIVGPPSTYTMWASFYGNVPLYMIKDPCKKIYLDDFKIQETF